MIVQIPISRLRPAAVALMGTLVLLLLLVPLAHSDAGDTTVDCEIVGAISCEVSDPDGIARILVRMNTALGPVNVVEESYSACPQAVQVSWDPIVPNYEIVVEPCREPATTVAVTHGGLTLLPEGEASLSLEGSDVNVRLPSGLAGGIRTNISGQFFATELADLDEGGLYELTVSGRDGLGNTILFLILSARVGADNTTLLLESPDFGTDGFKVQIYDGGRLVDERNVESQRVSVEVLELVDQAVFSANSVQSDDDCVWLPHGNNLYCCIYVDGNLVCPFFFAALPSSAPVDLDGDGVGVSGDLIVIFPLEPSDNIDGFAEAVITGAGDDALIVDDVRNFLFGPPGPWSLPHLPLGNAELSTLNGERLYISDIGISGNDGVQIGDSEWKYVPIRGYGWTLQFDPQDGGMLRFRTFDSTDNPISTLTAEFYDDGLLLSPHFQTGTYTAQYWDGEALVKEFTAIPSGTAVTPDPGLPTEPSCAQGKFETHICNLHANCWDTDGDAWCWYFSDEIVIPGTENNPQYATWLRMVAEEPRPTVPSAPVAADALTPIAEIQILASDIPVIALLDAEFDQFHKIYLPTIWREGTAR